MYAKPGAEDSPQRADDKALSRRAVLLTGAAGVAVAGAAAANSPALADTTASSFGAPVVELTVPAGALTPEQKAAMIKGVTDVLDRAMTLDPSRRMFVEIIETAEGGFGVNGQVFVPRAKR